MKAVRSRGGFRWPRWLALATLAFLLGPMAVGVTGCFTLVALVATSGPRSDMRIVPAGDAIYLEPGQEIRLHLRDGTTVRGRFAGRSLLALERYRQRFEARAARGGWTPLALGESLAVELDDGTQVDAPFGGYAMRSLVLRQVADSLGRRVPFESARSVRHQRGGVVSLDSLLAADVRGELPSAEAIVLIEGDAQGIAWRPGPGKRLVALEEIERVTIGRKGPHPAGLILAGVALDVAIFIALRDSDPLEPSCNSNSPPPNLLGVRVTERPFDRVLGRFVDEQLAWPDSLSELPESGHGTH